MKIKIPNYKKVGSANGSYTVFCIEIEENSDSYVIFKRYKEFNKLHNLLSSLKYPQPDFPSKTILKFSSKVLEQRRLMFQHYLQVLVDKPNPSNVVLDFLRPEGPKGTCPQKDAQPIKRPNKGCQLTFSQPIISILSSNQSLMFAPYEDDMIESAVISAIYDA